MANIEPNLITYNALIHACAQVGATDAAFQVWHQLRASGRTQPNVRTFTELIGACCKAQALDAAFGLLYQMLQEQVEPSRVTFDILLRAACAMNTPTRFFELKQLIASAGIELSEATVTLINEMDQAMLHGGLHKMVDQVNDVAAPAAKESDRSLAAPSPSTSADAARDGPSAPSAEEEATALVTGNGGPASAAAPISKPLKSPGKAAPPPPPPPPPPPQPRPMMVRYPRQHALPVYGEPHPGSYAEQALASQLMQGPPSQQMLHHVMHPMNRATFDDGTLSSSFQRISMHHPHAPHLHAHMPETMTMVDMHGSVGQFAGHHPAMAHLVAAGPTVPVQMMAAPMQHPSMLYIYG